MAQGNFTFGKYIILNQTQGEFTVCFQEERPTTGSVWQLSNPIMKSLPLFAVQLSLVILVLCLLMFLLRPLRQPRFVAEILTGILLGPTLIGLNQSFTQNVTPFEGIMVMETIANLGLAYYMFVVGLEMDLKPIRNNLEATTVNIAIAGILIPMGAGYGLYKVLLKFSHAAESSAEGGFFWAIVLTFTSFPDLARILSDLKLLHTDLGKTALTVAIISDLSSWVFLVITVSAINGNDNIVSVVPTAGFILVIWILVRPALIWVIQRTASSESGPDKYNDTHVFFVLTGVVICGFITDFLGSHSMVGAFMFGLIIPSGDLGTKIMDRIEEYITGIMLPPIFFITGIRTNLRDHLFNFSEGQEAKISFSFTLIVVLVIILACSAKIVSTLIASFFLKISSQDALALGFLINTKGVLSIIILNEGRNLKGLNNQTFATMMVALLIMTAMVSPVVSFVHKPSRRLRRFQLRTLEKIRPDLELTVLAGVYTSKNVNGLINLLQLSNATPKSPMAVFAVHLVELTGRASAMLIFHDSRRNQTDSTNITSRDKAEVEHIISSFEGFERNNAGAIVRPLTIVSPYATMHEDIGSFAEDKGVTLILLPFHKKPAGNNDDQNLQHKNVNKYLLDTASCSVGILVDRGLQATVRGDSNHSNAPQHCKIIMIFIGGPDDREALAYAWRMAGSRSVKLSVLRFLAVKEVEETMAKTGNWDDEKFVASMTEIQNQKQIDDKYINEFRFRIMCNQSITYAEKRVEGGDQIVEIIKSTYSDLNLYVVGRGQAMVSPLVSGLEGWSDCPELGPLGETLVASEFLAQASVLIVQQAGTNAWRSLLDDQKGESETNNGRKTQQQSLIGNHQKNDGFEASF